MRWTGIALWLFAAATMAQGAADDDAALILELMQAIEMLSDYHAPTVPPPLFFLSQSELEAKVCEQPCNVSAAYIPHQGIFLAGHLDPRRDPFDRAALLHELVHYLQQGHPKFAHLHGCDRERAKEREAYALQNAYLAKLHEARRVTFYENELDCSATQ
jgi:hypothetical protein